MQSFLAVVRSSVNAVFIVNQKKYLSALLLVATSFFSFSQVSDSAISFRGTERLPEQQRIAALNKLSKKYSADSTDLSIELANEALHLAKKYHDRRQEAIAMVNLAEGYLYNDLYDKALLYNSDALEIFNQLGDPFDAALALTSLGWLYYDVSDPQNSLLYHQRALEILRNSPDKERLTTAINAVGLAYVLGKNFSKAIPYFEESLAFGRAIGNKVRISESLDNIGEAVMELGRYEESLTQLKESYEISRSLNDGLRQAETLDHIARVLIFLKRFKESEQNLLAARELIELSSSNTKKEMLLDNALIGSSLYAALNDYQQSLKYLKQYNIMRNEILSEAKKNSLAQMRITYETQKKEEEIRLLEKEKEIKILQRNALGGGIVLLSVIGYLVYSRQRNARLKEKQLSEVREVLIKKELEKETLEKEALHSKLEHKSAEMTNFALHISQRNDLVRSFLEELNGVKLVATPDVASKLGKVIQQFGHIQEVNKEAEDFHLNVEAEYREFFFNLAQRFPDLTENEKRLCAQVRLNLSIKDIASLNNVSVKSVEMARYRLRKRFNLDHDETFSEWLRKF